MVSLVFFFFFQAEDGIRDRDVTGVQTCALPIFAKRKSGAWGVRSELSTNRAREAGDRRRVKAQELFIGWRIPLPSNPHQRVAALEQEAISCLIVRRGAIERLE